MISTVGSTLSLIFCFGGLFLGAWIGIHYDEKLFDGSVHGRYEVVGREIGQTIPWYVFATGEPLKEWADTEPTFVTLIFTSTMVVLLSRWFEESGWPKTATRLIRLGAVVFGSLMLIGWILHLGQPIELGSPGDFPPWRRDRCDPVGNEFGDLACLYKSVEQPSFLGIRMIPENAGDYDLTVCHLRPDYRPVQKEIGHAMYQLGVFLLIWLSVLCQSV